MDAVARSGPSADGEHRAPHADGERRAPHAPTIPTEDALTLLAHDMRASLTVLRGFAATLNQRWRQMREVQISASLETMVERAEELLGLTEDFLEIARAESGRLDLQTAPVALPDLLEAAIARARVDFPHHRFVARFAGRIPPVVADPELISRVAGNLLLNAGKNAPPGSSVEVAAALDADAVVVSVTDHGPGIPREVVPFLFEKFPHRRPRGGGVGLGLYLCRLIVEAHGGRVWASSGEDRTTFAFRLGATACGDGGA